MRNLALGALALLGVAAVTASSPAEARWAPDGSYRSTCRGINFDGELLTASCQRRNGTWRNTYLDNADDCDSNIGNNDGQLECGWSGWRRPDYSGYGPTGSYRDTCTNIRMDGYTLRATCQRSNGSWKWTWLEDAYDCSYVVNWNGNLTCRRR